MNNSEDVFLSLRDSYSPTSDVIFSALTPNLKGLHRAIAVGVKQVAVFGAASETFSQKNINCTVDESLQRFELVCRAALDEGIKVRGYVSCVLGCPYEGINSISPERVTYVTQKVTQ